MSTPRYDRQILALNDTELEQFVRDWVASKKPEYFDVTRFSGAGDRGRDVVGFLSNKLHEGPWHNYQCKQYGQHLSTATVLNEIGKVLYYAYTGEFSAPSRFSFVAPRGVNRNVEKFFFNPGQFRDALLSDWDKSCATSIISNQVISLDSALKGFIESIDFSIIERVSLDDILSDAYVKPALFKWFGADPGPAPLGKVPTEIESSELPYIGQLLDAYGQREGRTYAEPKEISDHQFHGPHLVRQRERYYDAAAFKRFYRDNTDKNVLDTFENDIFHGVVDTCTANHLDALTRVDAVMAQAASVQPAGPLAHHARVPVKQGVCHHFANEDKLKWRA